MTKQALWGVAAISLLILLGGSGCASPAETPNGLVDVGEQPVNGPIGIQDGDHDDEPIDPWADVPAVNRLEPALRAALQSAAADARAQGVDFWLTSGWRSSRYQQKLLDDAITNYRSEREARKLVKTPEESKHVTGDAIDIGPTDANSWMSIHGADYGLCQAYANEMWHFELLAEPGGLCPPMTDDAAG